VGATCRGRRGRNSLLGFLERQRATFAWKSRDLDAAGLRATLGPSALLLDLHSRGHDADGLVGVAQDARRSQPSAGRPCGWQRRGGPRRRRPAPQLPESCRRWARASAPSPARLADPAGGCQRSRWAGHRWRRPRARASDYLQRSPHLDTDAPIAIARVLRRQLLDVRQQGCVISRMRHIMEGQRWSCIKAQARSTDNPPATKKSTTARFSDRLSLFPTAL
jgi:hypothetical protein